MPTEGDCKAAIAMKEIAVTAGDLIDQAIEAVTSALPNGEPVRIENVPHPVNTTLGLAHATKSKFNGAVRQIRTNLSLPQQAGT